MNACNAGFDVTLARGASAFVSAEGAESMDDALKKKGIKVVD